MKKRISTVLFSTPSLKDSMITNGIKTIAKQKIGVAEMMYFFCAGLRQKQPIINKKNPTINRIPSPVYIRNDQTLFLIYRSV